MKEPRAGARFKAALSASAGYCDKAEQNLVAHGQLKAVSLSVWRFLRYDSTIKVGGAAHFPISTLSVWRSLR
jgi:hypothetical protein